MDFSKLIGGKGDSNNDDDNHGGYHGKGSKSRMVYDFDPTGLERAAKSSQELKDNPYANKILDLRDKELQNRRTELINEQKAYDLKIEQTKLEGVKQQHEYAIEVLKEEARTHKSKAEYEDFLARERKKDTLKIQNASHNELLKLQEESIKRQEEVRKKTIDYELQKKSEYDKQFSENFWKNKAIYEKETKDINLAQLEVIQKANKDMKLSVMEMREQIFSKYLEKLNMDPTTFGKICLGLICLTTCTVGVSRGFTYGYKFIYNKYAKPKLVRNFTIDKSKFFNKKCELNEEIFEKEGLFYNSNTNQSLIKLIDSTKNLKDHKGYMRNFLFYGPPGNGKTLFAQKLSEYSSLNYCMVSGGDLLPMKEKSVDELNRVFDWANKQNKGLIIFLDEADAFLKKRDKSFIGENMRSALNTFLYRTSSPSKNVMLVMSTNKPEQLDRAVTDRIDGIIEFPLPDLNTRIKFLKKYFHVEQKKFQLQDIDQDQFISTLANETEGLSLRQLSKLCIAYEAAALSKADMVLNKDAIVSMAKDFASQDKLKEEWDEDDLCLSKKEHKCDKNS